MNIVEFLDARIAEDEAVASLLSKGDAGHSPRTEVYTGTEWVTTPLTTDRILAECKAKQGILLDYMGQLSRWEKQPTRDMPDSMALRYLSLPYADHPEYQQWWTPPEPGTRETWGRR